MPTAPCILEESIACASHHVAPLLQAAASTNKCTRAAKHQHHPCMCFPMAAAATDVTSHPGAPSRRHQWPSNCQCRHRAAAAAPSTTARRRRRRRPIRHHRQSRRRCCPAPEQPAQDRCRCWSAHAAASARAQGQTARSSKAAGGSTAHPRAKLARQAALAHCATAGRTRGPRRAVAAPRAARPRPPQGRIRARAPKAETRCEARHAHTSGANSAPARPRRRHRRRCRQAATQRRCHRRGRTSLRCQLSEPRSSAHLQRRRRRLRRHGRCASPHHHATAASAP
mmetsp:Transcript_8045/g.24254  ORF Transcript_8045/g.24254 Transcript_8045/m.24254 type:complete len:283 (-) Transcript_8045:542-1390(-)